MPYAPTKAVGRAHGKDWVPNPLPPVPLRRKGPAGEGIARMARIAGRRGAGG